MMKRKELEQHLQDVEGFEKPKILLEQYETAAHIASCMIHTIENVFKDIDGKKILDLGCGCSVLGIGSALMGASFVLGVDIDQEALEIARTNVDYCELNNIDFLQCDVKTLPRILNGQKFDTVVMNPPFGTKNNKGLDCLFVEIALACVKDNGAVYSLHKTSTRDFFLKKSTSWNTEASVLAQLRYDLPATYKCHRKASVDIEVDFWRFSKNIN